MEILQFLLSEFLKNGQNESLKPLFELLKDNSFDIKKVIKNLSPEIIAPFIQNFTGQNKSRANARQFNAISPIANIADRDIVYSLNKYFGD